MELRNRHDDYLLLLCLIWKTLLENILYAVLFRMQICTSKKSHKSLGKQGEKIFLRIDFLRRITEEDVEGVLTGNGHPAHFRCEPMSSVLFSFCFAFYLVPPSLTDLIPCVPDLSLCKRWRQTFHQHQLILSPPPVPIRESKQEFLANPILHFLSRIFRKCASFRHKI